MLSKSSPTDMETPNGFTTTVSRETASRALPLTRATASMMIWKTA